jgi:hypothetical protein
MIEGLNKLLMVPSGQVLEVHILLETFERFLSCSFYDLASFQWFLSDKFSDKTSISWWNDGFVPEKRVKGGFIVKHLMVETQCGYGLGAPGPRLYYPCPAG